MNTLHVFAVEFSKLLNVILQIFYFVSLRRREHNIFNR